MYCSLENQYFAIRFVTAIHSSHSKIVICHAIIPFKHTNIICNNVQVKQKILTLTVLVATIDAQWEGMGDVGSAKYELALLLPCPTIRVLSYNN